MDYNERSLTNAWWSEVFGADVSAGAPERVGSGQVGMNLRYRLTSSSEAVPATVVVKMASPDPVSRATGVALRNYEREVRFYNEIVSSLDVRTPRCYFADWNPESGDIAIVLEDMAPAEQGDQIAGCSLEQARVAVTELARLHGPRWNDDSLFAIDWLQRRESDDDATRLSDMFSFFKPGFLGNYREPLQNQTAGRGEAFIDELESRIVPYVLAKDRPFTVTHGDYRLDNLLFATTSDGPPCTVVDWQTPGHGNGIGDLAYFIGAGLLPEERRAHEWDLVDLYIAGIEDYGHTVDHDWVRTHYRREAISGVIMAVIASQIVGHTERGDLMFTAMAVRHVLQGLENGALDLL